MAELSQLNRREFPRGAHSYLRCQLGRIVHEQRQVGEQYITVSLFHLLGFGDTWEAAIEMVEQRRARKEAAEANAPSFGPLAPVMESRRTFLDFLRA